jgi:hypothetical protein
MFESMYWCVFILIILYIPIVSKILIASNLFSSKDHLKICRTHIDDLIPFHRKRNPDLFVLLVNAQNLFEFSIHECNAHIGFRAICSL